MCPLSIFSAPFKAIIARRALFILSGGITTSLFVIADLHLSFGVDKPMDIFGGWKDHVSRIEENWQKKIKPEDTVVIPGDISWGMDYDQSREDFAFIDRLNGIKIISKGNHDYWWETKTKTERFFKENGFDTLHILHNNHYRYENIGICGTRGWINEPGETASAKVLAREAGRLSMSIESALKEGLMPVVFLHYPPVYGSSCNYDMLDVLHKYDIKRCYYGHLHGSSHRYAINGERDGIEYRLISSDFLQFDPLDITEIVQSDK
ncbi:MAG: metallophosphoesterase [Ruminococcus sp.]|nr:metallophosphoesterase [Ruminococcus sp.]MBQ7071349.1 metallophosphoesterase [Ruminococcus sp.]